MSTRLIGLDFETTSLDVATTRILEVSLALLDENYDEIAPRVDLVLRAEASDLTDMPQVVHEMHARSGLLDALTGDEAIKYESGLEFIGNVMSGWMDGAEPGTTFALFGSGVMHFDAALVARFWPQVFERLVYWIADDVGYLRRAYHQATGTDLSLMNTAKTHRANDDLTCHIGEAREFAGVFRQIGASLAD